MARPFDALGERLLRAGIAPRHVRRYLRELNEHLADLVTDEAATGAAPDAATAHARTRLGTMDELVQAMIAQPRLRSLGSRAPWAAFVLLPTLAVIATFFVLISSFSLLVHHLVASPRDLSTVPAWFGSAAPILLGTANLLVPPVIATTTLILARRQRIASAWPFAGAALIAIIGSNIDLSLRPHAIAMSVYFLFPHGYIDHAPLQLIAERMTIDLMVVVGASCALRSRFFTGLSRGF